MNLKVGDKVKVVHMLSHDKAAYIGTIRGMFPMKNPETYLAVFDNDMGEAWSFPHSFYRFTPYPQANTKLWSVL